MARRNHQLENERRNPRRAVDPAHVSAGKVALEAAHIHFVEDDAWVKLLEPLPVDNLD